MFIPQIPVITCIGRKIDAIVVIFAAKICMCDDDNDDDDEDDEIITIYLLLDWTRALLLQYVDIKLVLSLYNIFTQYLTLKNLVSLNKQPVF